MIGVFDSGYGGLSVLRHLRAALPDRDFVYLGDSGRAPYGGRSVDTLLDLSEQAVEWLFAEGCRLVVVACNTVSCVALRHLQRRYARPGVPFAGAERRVLGVTIPGAELAVRESRGHIGVLATARTVTSHTYVTEIGKLDPTQKVTQRAAPLLAPIVEEGWEDSPLALEAVGRYLEGLEADTILLGCTHYPFLAPAFARMARPGTRLVDPAPWLAARLVDWLARHPGFDDGPGTGALRVWCTGDPEAFLLHGSRFLGEPLRAVGHVAEVSGRLVHLDPASAPRGQVVRE